MSTPTSSARGRMGAAVALGLATASAAIACGRDGGPAVHAGPSASPPRDTSASTTASSPPPLVPRPRSTSIGPRSCEAFTVDASTRIATDPGLRTTAAHLARWLGLDARAVDVLDANAPDPAHTIVLRASRATGDGGASSPDRDPAVEPPATLEDEAYTLEVTAERAVVRAAHSAGGFYGAQALAQLAGARRIGADAPPIGDGRWLVPCGAIEDAPRLRVRAMHLDVARHYFDKKVVERYVDLLAFYRFNVFHWHLTDDQGFRIEVKSHPELTATGGRDGFYTQDDAREIVRYARERGITVIPEIEMPGHARAILASHPELSCTGKKQEVPRTWGIFDDVLCAGNEGTYALLDEVLGEVAAVFPSRMIHVGGDEVPTSRWGACAKCRAAMKANGVTLAELEGHVMRRVAATLRRLGRRPLVWDDALEGLAARRDERGPSSGHDPVVVAWQSSERGREAAARGFDVVMAPNQHVYFNFHQSRAKSEPGHVGHLPWTKVRTFDPLAEVGPDARAHVVGGEGALWTEYVHTQDDIDTLVMPRMAALAESLWSGPAPSEEDFVARFSAQLPALDASGVRYFVDPPTGAPERKVIVEGTTTTVTLAPPRLFPRAVVRYTLDGSAPTASSPAFEGPLSIQETTTISSAAFLPTGRASPVVRSEIVVERPRPAVSASRGEAGTSFTYVEGDFHRLPDFDKLAPKARGRAEGVSLAALERALGAKVRAERFAARFEGLVDLPSDGVYRFVARADDGVRVEVDGEVVVEDDGEHEPRDAAGEIALARGLHRLRVTYFQGTEGKELELRAEGPGLPLAPVSVLTEATTKR